MTLRIAQNDEPELLEWMANASKRGGGFISALADAGLAADYDNYPLIRPLLLTMQQKYPQYAPTEAVKRELRDHQSTCPRCGHVHSGDDECGMFMGKTAGYCQCRKELSA